MRLSEKTLEINFCAQFSAVCHHTILWYGLTQGEEAALGFDVATQLGGTSLLFQVKASHEQAYQLPLFGELAQKSVAEN